MYMYYIFESKKWQFFLETILGIVSDRVFVRQERKKSLSQGLGMRYTAEVVDLSMFCCWRVDFPLDPWDVFVSIFGRISVFQKKCIISSSFHDISYGIQTSQNSTGDDGS